MCISLYFFTEKCNLKIKKLSSNEESPYCYLFVLAIKCSIHYRYKLYSAAEVKLFISVCPCNLSLPTSIFTFIYTYNECCFFAIICHFSHLQLSLYLYFLNNNIHLEKYHIFRANNNYYSKSNSIGQ